MLQNISHKNKFFMCLIYLNVYSTYIAYETLRTYI